MQYMVCCVPVCPMRKTDAHRAEMVSQLLFGEKCTLLESGEKGWLHVQGKYDEYTGWVQDSHVTLIEENQYNHPDKELVCDWVNEINYNGYNMMVPYGSSLSAFQNGKAFWRKNTVHFKGNKWKPGESEINAKIIKQISYKFLNTSYLWGGKSIFGIDCSGFAQMVYKFLNIPIPRDAYQQAEKGTPINFLAEAKCGDLAFFDNDEGRIIHVGILLNEHEIIHSSGKVRIDKIDVEGILNLETKQRTHKLRIIKRYF